jgi:hypothetical protein
MMIFGFDRTCTACYRKRERAVGRIRCVAEAVSCLVRWVASLLHQRAASVRAVADPAEVGSSVLLH